MSQVSIDPVEADQLRVTLAPFRINLVYWRREVEIRFEGVKASQETGLTDLTLLSELELTHAGLDLAIDELYEVIEELGYDASPAHAELDGIGEAFQNLRRAVRKMIELEKGRLRPN